MIKSTSDMDNYYSGPPRSGRTRPNYTNSTYANVPNQHISEPSGDKLKGFKQSDSRVSASLASTGKLTGSQNPYALYDSIDNDSLDDGIHMGKITYWLLTITNQSYYCSFCPLIILSRVCFDIVSIFIFPWMVGYVVAAECFFSIKLEIVLLMINRVHFQYNIRYLSK